MPAGLFLKNLSNTNILKKNLPCDNEICFTFTQKIKLICRYPTKKILWDYRSLKAKSKHGLHFLKISMVINIFDFLWQD